MKTLILLNALFIFGFIPSAANAQYSHVCNISKISSIVSNLTGDGILFWLKQKDTKLTIVYDDHSIAEIPNHIFFNLTHLKRVDGCKFTGAFMVRTQNQQHYFTNCKFREEDWTFDDNTQAAFYKINCPDKEVCNSQSSPQCGIQLKELTHLESSNSITAF